MDTTTIMVKRVPARVRDRFKIICLEKHSNMSAEIIKYMVKTVEQDDKKRGKK